MTTKDTIEDPGFKGPWWLISSVVVTVLVIAAVVIFFMTSPPGEDTSESPAPATAAPSGAAVAACEQPASPETTLTAAPLSEWVLVGSMLAPNAPTTLGPATQDAHGIRSCWQHSPAGAAMFATNYFAQTSDIRRMPFITQLVADGPGRDVMERAMQDSVPGVSQSRIAISGVRLLSYSADGEVTVDVLLRSVATKQFVSFPLVIVWQNGDWKLVATDEGGFPLSSSVVESTAGYLPWAGE